MTGTKYFIPNSETHKFPLYVKSALCLAFISSSTSAAERAARQDVCLHCRKASKRDEEDEPHADEMHVALKSKSGRDDMENSDAAAAHLYRV